MRVRDPGVAQGRDFGDGGAFAEVVLVAIATKINAAKVPPGALEGKTFDEIRVLINEHTVPDGMLHQALLDEGLLVED